MYCGKRAQIAISKGFLKFGCVVLVIGLLLFGMAFLCYYNAESFAKTAKYTTGTVINLVQHNGASNVNRSRVTTASMNSANMSANNPCYFPVVNFTVNGHNYTFTSNSGSNPPSYQLRQSVSVMYDPQNPFTADINSWSSKWLAVIISAALGTLFTVFGILLIVFRNKVKP